MIGTSDREKVLELVKEANQSGATLAKACSVLNISVRTFERWNRGDRVQEDGRPMAVRPEPTNKLTEAEREQILAYANEPRFASLPPTQIVPTLADEGIYVASESTFYRTLKEKGQIQHRGRSRKRTVAQHPGSHRASAPNQVWSWDITWLPGPVKGQYYRLYLILDIFSRKAVGWEVWETEEAQYAEQLIKKAILQEKINRKPLVLHSDNGSPMKAGTFQVLLEKLGIQSSFSRPRVSNDNPFSEALFKTMKYRPGYNENGFESLEAARKWAAVFVNWYNHEHRHSGIQFVTPGQCHSGEHIELLKKRTLVYERAREKFPQRWKKPLRSWMPYEFVDLNPMCEAEAMRSNRDNV
jgi:putative transposase